MGQVIQVNGDYNIKARVGSTITLDTGPGVGYTKVTGNLVVEGDTLTVSTENLQVNDNIIVLNYGETGAGVTLRYSGIQIDRGTEPDAFLIFDENDNHWNFVTKDPSTPGYLFDDAKIRVTQISTDPDTNQGNLNLIGTGTGIVNVTGTNEYYLQVIEYGDDAIPNKKYVDYAIQQSPARQIKDDDSRILIADVNGIGTDYNGEPVTETEIAVLVNGVPNSFFYSNRAQIQGLEFIGTQVSNNDTNSNIYFRTSGSGKLQTNYSFQIEQIASTPASVSGYSQLFAKAPSTGDTGLYFVSGRNGELISKNRALLYSMLF